jgi:hypothetical protein
MSRLAVETRFSEMHSVDPLTAIAGDKPGMGIRSVIFTHASGSSSIRRRNVSVAPGSIQWLIAA